MDWISVVSSFVGASCGATLTPYLKAAFSRQAEIDTDFKNKDNLMATKRAESFEQEKGKRLATAEDIEKVLKEVQLVTEKAESIRAEIGQNVWKRQTIWAQKRDCYFAILEKSRTLELLIIDFHSALERVAPPAVDPVDLQALMSSADQQLAKSVIDGERAVFDGWASLRDEVRRANIFVGPATREILQNFDFFLEMIDGRSRYSKSKWQEIMNSLIKWNKTLFATAGKDLGVDE